MTFLFVIMYCSKCTQVWNKGPLLTRSWSIVRSRSNTPSSDTALPGPGVWGGAAPPGFHLAWDPEGATVSGGANHTSSEAQISWINIFMFQDSVQIFVFLVHRMSFINLITDYKCINWWIIAYLKDWDLSLMPLILITGSSLWGSCMENFLWTVCGSAGQNEGSWLPLKQGIKC